MTVGEFAEAVKKMRKLQKEYFRTHSQEMLHKSKDAERRVDRLLIERDKRLAENKQLDLFHAEE